jgi:NADH-quinone oxidoreductase subunit C
MTDTTQLLTYLESHLTGLMTHHHEAHGEVTIIVDAAELKNSCLKLRDEADFKFEQLMDVTVVDYLSYGKAEWETHSATSGGFDRGVQSISVGESIGLSPDHGQRFAVVYHLLSLTHNQRLRIKVFLDEKNLEIASINDIWPSANWFEREAFDLFGVYFTGHPDLRRILTDYGFVGHPFRKDFPLSGHVEVRYDAEKGQVIYEPVDIQPRILVPKIIREDERYVK